MKIYTVSLFGHREINNRFEIEKTLDTLLHEIITQKEFVEFLIGRDGEFDLMAASIIKNVIEKYDCGNTHFTLVLPYPKSEVTNNKTSFLDFYDEVEICAESSAVHYKSAIQVRNRCMVDRSDLVVCCIQHNDGGAYRTVRYAEKMGKKIINLSVL